MDKFKKIASIILRVVVTIGLLIFIFRQVDEKKMLEIIIGVNKPLLIIAFILAFINYILCLFRWAMLLKAANLLIPFKRILISFAGGIFFNLFLPSTIGGDLMRSIDLASHTKKPKEVLATVFLDRLSGYVGLVILSLASIWLGWSLVRDNKTALTVVTAITLLLVVVLLALFNKFFYSKINKLLHSPSAGKIREIITGVHKEVHVFRHQKGVIVKNLLISILVQIVTPLSFYFIALALGLKCNLIYFFIFYPIIGAITLLPISIGGLGLRDASTIFFFGKVGVVKDMAFAMSLISFLFILIIGTAGGLIYVFTVHHRRIQYNKPPQILPGE